MWILVRDLGNDEQLVKCSECGYQVIVDDDPPEECPNCGEPMYEEAEEEEEYVPRNIDLNKSSIKLDDVEEVPVVEIEKETPAWKLWYFWLILILSIGLIVGGGFVVKNFLLNHSSTPTEQENLSGQVMTVDSITFTLPTGWSESDGSYVNPGEENSLSVYSKEVSRFLKTEDVADLVYELSGAEKTEDKTAGNVEGKLLSRVIDTEDETGEPISILYSRYIFVTNGRFYMLTYRSVGNSADDLNSIINSLKVD